MLAKAGYSLFLTTLSSAGFNSSIFLTLHQLLKSCSSSCHWLHWIPRSHPFPLPHAEAGRGAAPERVSDAGVAGGSPVAEHRQEGEGQCLLPCGKSPPGLRPPAAWLSQPEFHPLIHQSKRVCTEEKGK